MRKGLSSLARAARMRVPHSIKVTLGIFESKGIKTTRNDTGARAAIWTEAVNRGITARQGVGDAECDAY
jgi:hypothetical protein